MLCRIEDLLLGAVGEAEREVSVFIHRRHRDHGDVDRGIALAVIGPVVAEQHRQMVGASLIDIFTVQGRAVPEVIGKGAVRVVFHSGDGDHGDGAADFDILQLSAPRRERGVEGLRVGTGLAVVHPVAVLHDPDSLFGAAELLCVQRMIIHIRSPPDQLSRSAASSCGSGSWKTSCSAVQRSSVVLGLAFFRQAMATGIISPMDMCRIVGR